MITVVPRRNRDLKNLCVAMTRNCAIGGRDSTVAPCPATRGPRIVAGATARRRIIRAGGASSRIVISAFGRYPCGRENDVATMPYSLSTPWTPRSSHDQSPNDTPGIDVWFGKAEGLLACAENLDLLGVTNRWQIRVGLMRPSCAEATASAPKPPTTNF